MIMGYESYAEREKNVQEARAKLDEAIQPFNRAAPRPFTDENAELYRKRTLPMVQQHAPNFQNVKVDDARGSAFDLLEKQIYDDARQEAYRPTQIPEGELRQITRRDATGRPFYEFAGSPSAWLKDFSCEKKYIKSIMDNRSFQKV
jgi:hypothetical protein